MQLRLLQVSRVIRIPLVAWTLTEVAEWASRSPIGFTTRRLHHEWVSCCREALIHDHTIPLFH